MLNRVSKGLSVGNGHNGNHNGGQNGCHVNGDKGEFDDLISALRAGDVFGENLVKMRRNIHTGTSYRYRKHTYILYLVVFMDFSSLLIK